MIRATRASGEALHLKSVVAGRVGYGVDAGAMRRLLVAVRPHFLAAPALRRTIQVTTVAAAGRQSNWTRNTSVAAGSHVAARLGESTSTHDGSRDDDLGQLRQLQAALSHLNDLYYNQQRTEISDAAYDTLKLQYRQLAARLRGGLPEEVELPVGAPLPATGILRKVPHRVAMLSLAAVNSREEAAAWLDKTLAKLPDGGGDGGGRGRGGGSGVQGKKTKKRSQAAAEVSVTSVGRSYRWVIEPKVDGLAVRVLYCRTAHGTYMLHEAATRGNGWVGEDVTHNALYGGINGLPMSLAVGPSSWSNRTDSHQTPLAPPSQRQQLQLQQLQLQQQDPADPGIGLVSYATSITPSGAANHNYNHNDDGSATDSACWPDWVEVRGEVFCRTADLELVNREQEAAGLPPFANTRNAASGAVRLLDPAECRRRRLSFVAYAALAPSPPPSPPQQYPPPPPPPPATTTLSSFGSSPSPPDRLPGSTTAVQPPYPRQWETLQWLKSAGFSVSPDNRLCDSREEVLGAVEEWMEKRATLGYDADGAVIKLDDTTLYDILGTAGSDPRWAVAWKFPGGEAVTRVEGVELTVGRQGQITPVALLSPVVVGGATIRRASLHNVGVAVALGLQLPGEAVVVRRSGDVIPQVVRVLPELRPPGAQPWQPPSACPACGHPLRAVIATTMGAQGRERDRKGESTNGQRKALVVSTNICGDGDGGLSDGEQLVCNNPNCKAMSERRMLHFAQVCMSGSGASRRVVCQLVEGGLLGGDISDWYTLDEATLSALPGFGPARTAALLASLDLSRHMSPGTLLRGLNIPRVGEVAAEALGRAFPSLEFLVAEVPYPDRIMKAAGVGPSVARSVADWFQQPVNQHLLTRLREAGVRCIAAAVNTATAAISTAAPPPPRTDAADTEAREEHEEGALEGAPRRVAAKVVVEDVAAGGVSSASTAASRLVGVEGMRVCVTGTLTGPFGTGLVRSEMRRMLETAGAEFHSAVKRDTQVLLAGKGAGEHKTRKAAASGVLVMGEREFWQRFWSQGLQTRQSPGAT